MYYVVDTHAFIWYLTDSTSLSKKARKIFDLADQGKATIIVPAIVILEIIDILEKKKVLLELTLLISKIEYSSNFILSEINWSLILEVSQVKGFKDLHDRIIVATAKIFEAQLISRDRIIKKAYSRAVW